MKIPQINPNYITFCNLYAKMCRMEFKNEQAYMLESLKANSLIYLLFTTEQQVIIERSLHTSYEGGFPYNLLSIKVEKSDKTGWFKFHLPEHYILNEWFTTALLAKHKIVDIPATTGRKPKAIAPRWSNLDWLDDLKRFPEKILGEIQKNPKKVSIDLLLGLLRESGGYCNSGSWDYEISCQKDKIFLSGDYQSYKDDYMGDDSSLILFIKKNLVDMTKAIDILDYFVEWEDF